MDLLRRENKDKVCLQTSLVYTYAKEHTHGYLCMQHPRNMQKLGRICPEEEGWGS